jgi:small subunit ribosomal protein S7
MPRKGPAKKRAITPDPVYHNRLVTRFVNRMMLDGKKSVSETIFYSALEQIESRSAGRKGIEVFEQAVRNVMPQVEVKPRRVGGATYQVPMEIRTDRKLSLALRWLVAAARKRSGKTMIERLASELNDAANNSGAAVRQREEKHKMADANKAFAHYRF